MDWKRGFQLTAGTAVAAVAFGAWARAADEVSGIITRTYMIVEDTDLTGDVTCNVPAVTPVSPSAHRMWSCG